MVISTRNRLDVGISSIMSGGKGYVGVASGDYVPYARLLKVLMNSAMYLVTA